MKRKMFSEINEQEKRAKLLSVIACKTKGKLTKEELEQIVNSVDINNQYSIIIISDPNTFAELSCINDKGIRRSWSGESHDISKIKLVLGELESGIIIFKECSNNGNIKMVEYNKRLSEFDINSNICIIRKTPLYDIDGRQNDYLYEIVIYVPGDKEYEADPKIQYILDNFNIGGK